jgi:hypothetical protein
MRNYFAIVALLFLGSCGTEGEENFSDETSNSEGLTIVTAVPGQELAGHFIRSGRKINFEALIGGQNEAYLAGDQDAPDREIDIRFTTAMGTPLIVSVGGDSLMDPSWGQGTEEILNLEDMKTDFQLVLGAVDNLARVELPPELESERRRIIESGLSVALESAANEISAGSEPQNSSGELSQQSSPICVGSGCQCGTFEHEVFIRKKRAFVDTKGNPFEHSAILLKVYSIPKKGAKHLFGLWESANHGTPASSTAMSTKCSKNFRRNTNYVQSLLKDPCPTPYIGWALIGPKIPVGYHTCNNDTVVQYAAIKNPNQQPSMATCWLPAIVAPNCD